ncbi:MAG TPA: hypothetical protein VME63_04300 [Dyella sp.]|uniref:hypothetical protein n=1 Tax=Dyella sp. TaxID=1869338 RepID=UPI002B725645|nr:hypothetical protein [Dyella sp.]HTV84600.1 hypothetical protein [Dyella sp.]
MRRYLVWALLVCVYPAHALESLRVGSQVLVVGDSAARVKALLGHPSGHGKHGNAGKASSKSSTARNSPSSKGKSSRSRTKDKGEKWQYWRDGHATTITIVDGKVAHIEDRAR